MEGRFKLEKGEGVLWGVVESMTTSKELKNDQLGVRFEFSDWGEGVVEYSDEVWVNLRSVVGDTVTLTIYPAHTNNPSHHWDNITLTDIAQPEYPKNIIQLYFNWSGERSGRLDQFYNYKYGAAY